MFDVTRQTFLQGLGAVAAAGAVAGPARALAAGDVTTLLVTKSTVEVLGRTVVRMLDVLQPNGTRGITTTVGSRFRVREINKLDVPTLMHWHGLTPPPHQDGVPIVSQPALPPGETYEYDFPLTEAGTYWMHSASRFAASNSRCSSGPLIIKDPADDSFGEQDVVVELADFSFTNPEQIYANLLLPATPQPRPLTPVAPGKMPPMKRDANDVNYDAFLANRRPVANPEVFRIEPRARVRLRLINSSSATNYTIGSRRIDGHARRRRRPADRAGHRSPIRDRHRATLRYSHRDARTGRLSDLLRARRRHAAQRLRLSVKRRQRSEVLGNQSVRRALQ